MGNSYKLWEAPSGSIPEVVRSSMTLICQAQNGLFAGAGILIDCHPNNDNYIVLVLHLVLSWTCPDAM